MKIKKKIFGVLICSLLLINLLAINSLAYEENVSTYDNNYKASEGYTGILINNYRNEYNIDIGNSTYLSLQYYEDGRVVPYANFDDVTWSSSNTSVATIEPDENDNGMVYVYAVSSGKATITATVKYNNKTYKNSKDITVPFNADGIVLSDEEVKLNVGDIYFVYAYCPEDDHLYDNCVRLFYEGDIVSAYSSPDYSANGFKKYNCRIKANREGIAILEFESYKTGEVKTCKIIVGNPTPTPDPTPDPDTASSVTMYRLYNPNTGEHFYTSDISERGMLINVGWGFEGAAWNAPSTGTPVYRLYNPNAYYGSHHYTTDVNEKNNLVNAGWRYEGVCWYSAGTSGTPLYRLYNPNNGDHHYTKDINERSSLVTAGWTYEGIAWYGL